MQPARTSGGTQWNPCGPMKYRVEIRQPDGAAHVIPVDEDERVLDAALAAGTDLPYSCLRAGV